jgi:hypothetical protein
MKTPVQKLIDSVGWMAQGLDADELYDYFMEEATRMLEKEKEVMCQFQSDGQRTDFWVKYEDNEDCFDETFKTKER